MIFVQLLQRKIQGTTVAGGLCVVQVKGDRDMTKPVAGGKWMDNVRKDSVINRVPWSARINMVNEGKREEKFTMYLPWPWKNIMMGAGMLWEESVSVKANV